MADKDTSPKALGEQIVDETTPLQETVAEQMSTADNRPDAIIDPVGSVVGPGAETPKPEEPAPQQKDEAEKKVPAPSAWSSWVRPILVLLCICLTVSFLLGVTNNVTLPLIEQNASKAADEARQAVLQDASGFENITPDPLPNNILSVYEASNGAGYVIEAFGKGYGGQVPVMVGFDTDGNITGVFFTENNETPGLGQNLSKPSFAGQFTGMEADIIELDDIDQLAGATLSSNAALVAINAASKYYTEALMGGTARYELSDDVWALLLPKADDRQELEVAAPGIAGAYLGSDGTYVIVAQGTGNNARPITVAVAMDSEGVILNLFVDAEGETEGMGPGKGNDIKNNTDFMSSFIGLTETDGIESIAGSTTTSDGVKQAVQLALDTLPLAKEAA